MPKPEFTDEELRALHELIGHMNGYEMGAILCKTYDKDDDIQRVQRQLLHVYSKIVFSL